MPDPDMPGQMRDVDSAILELDLESGDSTQPERFSDNLLAERKARIGPKLFSLHYHLDTSLADQDRYPLRLNDLVVLDLDNEVFPEKVIWCSDAARDMPSFGLNGDVISKPMWISDVYQPYKHTVMHIDPSGRGADETAVCIASFGNGYVWVHDILGFDGGYEDALLSKIVSLATEYPTLNLIRYEENYGDGMFGSLLRPHIGRIGGGQIGLEGYRVSGMKETRIIKTLEPVMSQHRLVFSKRAIRQENTQKQLTRLTETRGSLKHDDRVDVLAASVNYFEDTLGVDVDDIIATNAEKEQQEIVDSWLDDKRRADLLLGPRLSGANRVKTLNPIETHNTVFKQRKSNVFKRSYRNRS
jgi:predicted phage terminase large subunit-like protein